MCYITLLIFGFLETVLIDAEGDMLTPVSSWSRVKRAVWSECRSFYPLREEKQKRLNEMKCVKGIMYCSVIEWAHKLFILPFFSPFACLQFLTVHSTIAIEGSNNGLSAARLSCFIKQMFLTSRGRAAVVAV